MQFVSKSLRCPQLADIVAKLVGGHVCRKNRIKIATNRSCAAALCGESMLRATARKILLQQYRHFPDVPPAALDSRYRLGSGHDGAGSRRLPTLRRCTRAGLGVKCLPSAGHLSSHCGRRPDAAQRLAICTALCTARSVEVNVRNGLFTSYQTMLRQSGQVPLLPFRAG